MKAIAILSATFLLGIGGLQAATTKTGTSNKAELKAERITRREARQKEVSIQSQFQFDDDFGYIPDVRWFRSDNFDEATFTKNGVFMTAYYDDNQSLVGTTQPETVSDLPAGSVEKIREKYSDYTIGPVIFYHDNELNDMDMILYGFPIEDTDNYFVELTKDDHAIALKVDPVGNVLFFTHIR
jgi:hypothetical protein